MKKAAKLLFWFRYESELLLFFEHKCEKVFVIDRIGHWGLCIESRWRKMLSPILFTKSAQVMSLTSEKTRKKLIIVIVLVRVRKLVSKRKVVYKMNQTEKCERQLHSDACISNAVLSRCPQRICDQKLTIHHTKTQTVQASLNSENMYTHERTCVPSYDVQ